ncbi:Chromosome partition protein Smc [Nonomuraea coxensis DSM 45129]|uniref:Chromosome partition protein Smc n=1 Tax=Nonomuraea coxensis DSM 45129 TaxID=1122611 RepID=A0ABX8U9I6_9ACTN|nr:AAA family ATPase [Nonomuraea coxensis]QYC44419.1 Chromosome partition protein Smc [Nonomuraea coxensis DSM 45129]
MLTKLEVDGFKNLLNFEVELGPFTCIAGVNGTGKSNIFDVIQFLSLLADRSLIEAAQEVRGVHGERLGDPRDLFWNGYSRSDHKMSFAAEMIVPGEVEDDFGRPAKPSITFLRYELEIGYIPPAGIEKIGRLSLLAENLRHIKLGDAPEKLGFRHNAGQFRKAVLHGRRAGTAFISTAIDADGQPIISIHQDGGSRGQPKPAAASRAPATVVSTVTSSDDPTVLAARREMQSWRRLALEPSALRTADRYVDPRQMDPTGRHLAGTLFRIAYTDGDFERVYARVASRLADLSGIDVRELRVEQDDVRELFTVQLVESGGLALPARSLSEGTLRFLALCVLLEDPSVEGLLCMEEPENGIHPANLNAMVQLVQDLAVDPYEAPGVDNPFRQVIVNTHSPAVVQLADPQDLLFAEVDIRRAPDGTMARALSVRPLVDTWRDNRDTRTRAVSKADILPYLTTPPGAQLTLEIA